MRGARRGAEERGRETLEEAMPAVYDVLRERRREGAERGEAPPSVAAARGVQANASSATEEEDLGREAKEEEERGGEDACTRGRSKAKATEQATLSTVGAGAGDVKSSDDGEGSRQWRARLDG